MIENSKFNQNSKFKIQNFKLLFFLSIFILQLACLLLLTLAPSASQAADPIEFKPQVQIPGLEKEFTKSKTGGYILPQDTGGIAKYIRAIYKYAIGIVGILAAVVLMIGGVMWIIAGGSATMIGEAKAWIGASLTGLTLALLSYLILATVNPALVELKITEIKTVTPLPNFNASTSCGEPVPQQATVCGSKCPAGQTCKLNKAAAGMPGAKECPPNNGTYYMCDDCCKNNLDSDCPTNSSYICNMHNPTETTRRCYNQGICTLKQPKDGDCDENKDCQTDNCSLSSVYGVLKCQ